MGPLTALDKVSEFRGASVPEDRLFLALHRVPGNNQMPDSGGGSPPPVDCPPCPSPSCPFSLSQKPWGSLAKAALAWEPLGWCLGP